jgi:hypothetical protein
MEEKMKLTIITLLIVLTSIATAQVQVFTDESLYLTELNNSGLEALIEDFDGSDWDGVRNNPAPSVTSKGITWTASDQVNTGQGPARSGWAIYDHPGGDPDILYGSSENILYGLAGWFKTSTPYANVQFYLDGILIPDANMTIGTEHVFLGVIDPDGFTDFEIRDTEGTPEDQKHWFADDCTFGWIPPAEVPTLSQWGMLIMGLLLLALGTAAVLRRRRAISGNIF